MAQVAKKGNSFTIYFTEAEAKELGMKAGTLYELFKAREGIWVLTETHEAKEHDQKPAREKEIDEVEQKIIGMLRKLPPRDRMEGWFEKKLVAEEKSKFEQMLAKGIVTRYKSSEVFRKALYTVPKKSYKEQEAEKKFENTEKPFQEYTLEKDGFAVVKNEERAKAMSENLKEKIKSGEIRGTRAFTGEFYIINNGLLDASDSRVLQELKAVKSATLGELSEKTKLTPTLVRICLEFLKEEGQVIEKRKDLYHYIE